jgi:hypothetical protein
VLGRPKGSKNKTEKCPPLTLAEKICPKGLPLLFVDEEGKERIQLATMKMSGSACIDLYTIEDLQMCLEYRDCLPKITLGGRHGQ